MRQALALFVLMLVVQGFAVGAAILGERGAKTRRWQKTVLERSDQSRLAYKAAQVLVTADGETAVLSGITVGGLYTVEAQASCPRPGCTPPGLDCACGFYAFKRREDALELSRRLLPCNGLRHKALLAVELEGSVLQYTRGYRAERQRVLGVQFDRVCAECLDEGTRTRASCLAAAPKFLAAPVMSARGLEEPRAKLVAVRPVCDRHIPPAARTFGPSELAGLLGTEVSWLPKP